MHDLILFGATSFVGQITTQYLLDQYKHDKTLSWAIAGRSKQKLESLKAKDIPIIVADADSESDLRKLCEQTKVVISTVGPYDLYGSKLVKVCAETGTDYVDLTGESPWIKTMIEQHHETARKSGARIIHGCGFDSIPSDMGVWLIQQYLKKNFGEHADNIQMRVKSIKGGISGGTIASLINFFEKSQHHKELFKQLSNPYLLCPPKTQRQKNQHPINHASFDPISNSWIAPFFMASTNEAVVLRSNALNHYSPHFVYQEAMSLGKGPKGALTSHAISGAIKAFLFSMSLSPSRNTLKKWVLPKPGEGPSHKAQEEGHFDLQFWAKTPSGKIAQAEVKGNRDPGYGATARILAESAICLAQQIPKSEKAGGILTPASVFDERLIHRLNKNAGMSFKRREKGSSLSF